MTDARISSVLRRAAVVLGAALLLLVPTAVRAADLFYDATLSLPIGDDARFFLNLTNQHYAPPAKTAVAVVKRCPRPADDYPVVLLLARASHRPPADVLALRLRGMAWADVFVKLHVSPDVLFVGMDRDPGPPYGHAWGSWKSQRGRGPAARPALSDASITELTKLQIVSSYYRVSPYTVIGERRRGTPVERYAVIHGRPAGAVPARRGGHSPSARPARERGHEKAHGPRGGHGHRPHPDRR